MQHLHGGAGSPPRRARQVPRGHPHPDPPRGNPVSGREGPRLHTRIALPLAETPLDGGVVSIGAREGVLDSDEEEEVVDRVGCVRGIVGGVPKSTHH